LTVAGLGLICVFITSLWQVLAITNDWTFTTDCVVRGSNVCGCSKGPN